MRDTKLLRFLWRRVAGPLFVATLSLGGCHDSENTSGPGDGMPSDAAPDLTAGGDGPATITDAAGSDTAQTVDAAAGDASNTSDLASPPDLGSAPDLVTPSSVPSDPITFKKNDPFTLDSGTTNYVYVPTVYDGTHQTPITLFVWLHGCGGYSEGDVWTVSPGGSQQTWITMTVGGREGGCWNMSVDPQRVLDAIADIKTHFNIKPKGVIMGGYSSGGDLSYRTAFYNASQFAGILVENTSPFRDTGSTKTSSLAAASWKFNVIHLAHLQDDTYPIAGVRTETNAMITAGYPLVRIEREGTHWDDAGAQVNGHSVPGTAADLATYLFPYLDDGWMAP